MSSERFREFAWALIGATALVCAPALVAQETAAPTEASESQASPAEESQASPAEESQASPAEESQASPAEEEYDWLMDEEKQRRYRVEQIPKVARTFKRVDDERVRFPGGATFEVVDEDEEWFYVKVFEKVPNKAVVPRAKKPTPEALAERALAYQSAFEAADRIQLEPFDKGLPRSGQWRNGFDIADMNKDGHLDIVFGPARKGRGTPNIFLGDSSGNWKLWTGVKYAPAPYDYGAVTVGDLDNDGLEDMVFGIHLRGMFVARATGVGSFEPWSEGIEIDMPGQGGDATSFSSRAVELADWNKDGRLDIVALGEGPKGLKTQKDKRGRNRLINTARGFLVYLNNGDGTWTVHTQERGDNARANFGDDFSMDDLDGDGHWDLVSATRQLGSRHVLAETDADTITYRTVDEIRPSAFIDSTEIADLDGDGRKDIAVSYRNRELGVWRSGIDLLYAEEGGTFRRETLYSEEGKGSLTALASGQLNGDDRPDLVAGNENGGLVIFLSDKEKGFVAEQSPEVDQKRLGCRAFGIALVDLDGKKGDEIVIGFAGEPTGYPGFPNLSKPGCVREGSIRAWKVAASDG